MPVVAIKFKCDRCGREVKDGSPFSISFGAGFICEECTEKAPEGSILSHKRPTEAVAKTRAIKEATA